MNGLTIRRGLLSPSRWEKAGEGVGAAGPSRDLARRLPRSHTRLPAHTPIPGPFPLEGEGRSVA